MGGDLAALRAERDALKRDNAFLGYVIHGPLLPQQEARATKLERDALRADNERLADVLRWLDKLGGLGYEKHDRIRTALKDQAATSAPEPEREYTREEMREACRNNYRAGQLAERERPTVAQIAAIIQRWQSQPLTTSEISDGAAREIAGATVVPMERRVEAAAMALCEEIRRVEGSSSMTWEEMTEPDRRDVLRLVEVTIRAAAAAAPEPPA